MPGKLAAVSLQHLSPSMTAPALFLPLPAVVDAAGVLETAHDLAVLLVDPAQLFIPLQVLIIQITLSLLRVLPGGGGAAECPITAG